MTIVPNLGQMCGVDFCQICYFFDTNFNTIAYVARRWILYICMQIEHRAFKSLKLFPD